MREILFRGKRTDNGQWVYGDLRQYSKKHIGIYSFELQQIVRGIDPSTVGQYTGLNSNGKRIFEGDIVEFVDMLDFEYKAVPLKGKGIMCFCDGSYVICGNITHYRLMDFEMSVIGNIHDNPELMEAE